MVRSRATASELCAATSVSTLATENADWRDEIRRAAGDHTTFAAVDAIGGKIGTNMLELLSTGGTLASYGILSGEPPTIPQAPLTMEAKVRWSLLPHEQRANDLAAG